MISYATFMDISGGGYSSLLGPPTRRFSCSESGRRSTSVSSRVLSAYPMGGSFGIDDYFQETDGDEGDDEFDQITATSADAERPQIFLSVPHKVSISQMISVLWINMFLVFRDKSLGAAVTSHVVVPIVRTWNDDARP